MNNKKITKRGLEWAPLLFLYEVNIVVLIDFITILLTPGIFLIQIVNTNNTNIYLIHFHIKNIIKIHFPKSWVFKVSKPIQTFTINWMRWNKLHWHQHCHKLVASNGVEVLQASCVFGDQQCGDQQCGDRYNNATEPDFQKKILLYILFWILKGFW